MSVDHPRASEPVGIGGWLLLFCVSLLIWGPAQLGVALASAIGVLAVRGPLLGVVIIVRTVVAALGVAAGIAILNRHPGGLILARASVVATAATDTFVALTPYFPSNRMPGDERIVVGLTLVQAVAWLFYLSRSIRVRNTCA